MRIWQIAAVLSTGIALGLLACVGDDPAAVAPGPADDGGGGADGTSGSDGSSGGVDGAVSDSGGCSGSQVSCKGACVEPTSFATNPTSCGSCGHDCVGGACAGGKCQAIKIFSGTSDAATVEPVRNLVIDTTTVYFTAAQGPNGGGKPGLYSCPIAGCTSPTLIEPGNAFGLAITT